MNKISYLFFITSLLVLNVLYAQDIPKLRIDPAQAYGGTVSEYFDEVEYIPLETTKESLFGDTPNFIVTDSSFIIFDIDTHCLIFFSNVGKFLSKIKYPSGIWPQVVFNYHEKRLLVNYQMGNIGMSEVYTSMGSLVDKKKNSVPEDDLRIITHIDDSTYAAINSCYFPPGRAPQDININLIELYKNNKLQKSIMPFNQKENMAHCGLAPAHIISVSSAQDGTLYLSTAFTHFIYKVTKDTIQGLFQLIFPSERTIPGSFLAISDIKKLDSLRNTRWIRNDKLIISTSNISVNGNFLFFKIRPGEYIWTESSVENAQYNFIYNLKSGRLSSYEHITSDIKSFYLPISNGPRTSVNGVVNMKGYYYTPISSLLMFAAFEKNKSRNPQYPPLLQEYFATQTRKSNPVIVRMKLKE